MAYDVQFCDTAGKTMLGSDGVTYVDNRKTTPNILQDLAEHRERYRANFPHKFAGMSHCLFRGRVHKVPTKAQKARFPSI